MSDKCPLCGQEGIKIIMGVFPVRICQDYECSAVWGFWSRLACWATEAFYHPSDEGAEFAFVAYNGSYWKALFGYIFGRERNE